MGDERGGVEGLLNAVLTDFIYVIKTTCDSHDGPMVEAVSLLQGPRVLIPFWGTKIPHAIWWSQKTK